MVMAFMLSNFKQTLRIYNIYIDLLNS